MVEITTTYEGQLRCRATHGPSKNELITDAPADNMGKGEAFSPTDLVATALATCVAHHHRHRRPAQGHRDQSMRAHVEKHMSADAPRRIVQLPVRIWISAPRRSSGTNSPRKHRPRLPGAPERPGRHRDADRVRVGRIIPVVSFLVLGSWLSRFARMIHRDLDFLKPRTMNQKTRTRVYEPPHPPHPIRRLRRRRSPFLRHQTPRRGCRRQETQGRRRRPRSRHGARAARCSKLPDVEIAYLAEVDPKRLERGLKVVTDKQETSCQGVKDFRNILEDKTRGRGLHRHAEFLAHARGAARDAGRQARLCREARQPESRTRRR